MPGLDINQFEANNEQNGYSFEDFIENNKIFVGLILLGIILIGLGIVVYKKQQLAGQSEIEVLETVTESQEKEIIIEVSGAVEKPGVYKMESNHRIEDALIAAGGLSLNADREWVEKNINRAAKLTDGQKLYIRGLDKQTNDMSANLDGVYQSDTLSYNSDSEEKTNINEASLSELDKLPGIGPVYGQKIIEHRPYSNSEELVSKDIIPKSTYEKIKDVISVY